MFATRGWTRRIVHADDVEFGVDDAERLRAISASTHRAR